MTSLVLVVLFAAFPPGQFVENVACRSDPSQTYTLFLPSTYSEDRRWPVLLIFDPRGRGTFAAEIFREPAELFGWILISSNNTRSDGPWETNVRTVNALWPEAHLRVRSDPARIYAAGFSGGAIVAWSLAQTTQQVAGIISAGGRLDPAIPVQKIAFAHYGAAGVHDFNYQDMREIDALLEQKGALHRFEVFPGGHQWLPKDYAADAIEWLEIVAMKRGLRPRDDALIERTYARNMSQGRYEMAAATYDGLRDVTEARAQAERRRADPETRRKEREQDRWAKWEAEQVKRALQDLRLGDLKRRAGKGGAEGDAAQRVLEMIYVQTSFYMPRELFEQKRYRDAAAVLEIAVSIKDDARAWYNLGAARARLGRRDKALDALEQAIRRGFSNMDHLRSDPDYESVRSDPRFQRIVKP